MPSRRAGSADPRSVLETAYQRMVAGAAAAAAAQVRAAIALGLPADEGIPALLDAISRVMAELPAAVARRIRRFVKQGLPPELLDGATLRAVLELFRMSAATTVSESRARALGEYEIDEFGLDPAYVERIRPLLRFMYRSWWRVKTTGLWNVPADGRALLVANHSGIIAWDGAMVATAVMDEHPAARLPRALHLEWFVRTPFAASFLQRTGQVMAHPQNGERLLGRDHLVTVFPEGAKGAGKPYRQRYKLARFGRGGFVRMALHTRSRIVPVAIVGGEEIHPVLGRSQPLARLFGLPYFPITPTFPWLGPLGLVPLPSKWRIDFGEPIDLSHLPAEAADDFHVVSQVSDEVRFLIQSRVDQLREERGGAYI